VHVISTVVTFPAFVDVTQAIQFPVSPLSPFGISKSKTAAVLVPVLVTLALHPASIVVVVPAAIVAAVHGHHWSPLSPFGIVNSRTASSVVPLLVTHAHVPAAPVVVLQTQTVAAVPGFP